MQNWNRYLHLRRKLLLAVWGGVGRCAKVLGSKFWQHLCNRLPILWLEDFTLCNQQWVSYAFPIESAFSSRKVPYRIRYKPALVTSWEGGRIKVVRVITEGRGAVAFLSSPGGKITGVPTSSWYFQHVGLVLIDKRCLRTWDNGQMDASRISLCPCQFHHDCYP